MANTPLGLRYPLTGNTPDVPRDIKNLADDTDAVITSLAAQVAVSAVSLIPLGVAWTDVSGSKKLQSRMVDGVVHFSGSAVCLNLGTDSANDTISVSGLTANHRPNRSVQVLVPRVDPSVGALALLITSAGRLQLVSAGAVGGWEIVFDGVSFVRDAS